MPVPIGLRGGNRKLWLAALEQLTGGLDEEDDLVKVVRDVIGSKAQNRVPVRGRGVLFGAVGLKGEAVVMVGPAVDLHDELAHQKIEAISAHAGVVNRENTLGAQGMAHLPLRRTIRPDRRKPNRLLQRARRPAHSLAVVLQPAVSLFAVIKLLQ